MPLPLSLNSATAAKSLVRESGGTWRFFFYNLESLIQSVCDICGLQAEKNCCIVTLSSTSSSVWSVTAVHWIQERTGFALNMRVIGDSCQLTATLSGNQRLNRLESCSVSWHMTCCPVNSLTSGSIAQHRLLNESSLQFHFYPVLAHFQQKD